MKRKVRRLSWPPIAGGVLLVLVSGWWMFSGGSADAAEDPQDTRALVGQPVVVPQAVMVEDRKPAPAAQTEMPVADASVSQTMAPPEEVLTPRGATRTARRDESETSSPRTEQPLTRSPAETEIVLTARPDARPDPVLPLQDPRATGRVAAVMQRYQAGQKIEARDELNRMLRATRDVAEQRELREHLAHVNEELIFGKEIVQGDPLFERYRVQSGDMLTTIGRRFSVPYEIIMRINNISDARRIREGQVLKVPRGPFHARVQRGAMRLDLYLGDTYVRSFPVGLGKDNGTPLGKWKVTERLPNPTYYPPESAVEKRVIPPRHPDNPLGAFWIALEGVEGDAVGRAGYGIHGTNDPSSIGKSESLGCIRMHDRDIELIYGALQPGASTVITEP